MNGEELHAALLAELEQAERTVHPDEGIPSITINSEGAPSRDALVIMRRSTVVAANLGPLRRGNWDRPTEVRPYQKLREA